MSMTNSQIGGLIGFSLLLSVGQALFKMAATSPPASTEGSARFVHVLHAPSFWLALALYGVATLLWTYLLQFVPLSRAYPFAALGFVIVPLMAVGIFGEKLNVSYAMGAALVVLGIIITTRS